MFEGGVVFFNINNVADTLAEGNEDFGTGGSPRRSRGQRSLEYVMIKNFRG
jgi:hypothetical protein